MDWLQRRVGLKGKQRTGKWLYRDGWVTRVTRVAAGVPYKEHDSRGRPDDGKRSHLVYYSVLPGSS